MKNTATTVTATASENSTRITKWAKRYLGVAKRMKNDEVAICVEYIDRTNIVIEFPAYGNYRVRTSTKAFNDGKVIIDETIEKPRLPKKERLKYERIGMEKVMHNGAKAKCVAYRSAIDCDFELSFPDGKKVIVTEKRWPSFVSGCIGTRQSKRKKTQAYIGETRKMNCGMNATITAYKNYSSMTVKFENGIVKEGVAYSSFKKGAVAYSTVEAKKRNGKIRKANFAAKREGTIFDIDSKRYILLDYISSQKCVFLDIDTDKTITRSFFWASTGGTMNAHNPLVANKVGRKRHRRSTFDHLGEIYYLKNGLSNDNVAPSEKMHKYELSNILMETKIEFTGKKDDKILLNSYLCIFSEGATLPPEI